MRFMRYIALLLLFPIFPLVAFGQSTTQLVDKTTGAWLSPAPALVKSGNGLGLVANPLSQFAATTSLQIKNTISDETGSDSLVFANSPTFTGTVLGSNLTLTGILSVQNGDTGGVIKLGADVNATTLTSNTRKLGAVLFPRYGSSTQFQEALTWDTTSGVSSSILHIGGRAAGSGRSAQNIYLSVNSSETATGATQFAGVDSTSFYFGTNAAKLRWSHTDSGADQIIFWDDSAGGYLGLTLSGLTITGTSLAVDAATESTSGVIQNSTTAEAQARTDDTTAMSPADVASTLNYTTSVNLTSDNQTITVGTARTILVTSDSGTATARTFDLDTAPAAGARLTLIWTDPTDKGELSSANVQMRTTTHTFNEPDTLHFVSSGSFWNLCGMGRGEDLYSTDEMVVGQWIDGTILYRKTIDIGALPNAGTTNDAHGITGAVFTRIYGMSTDGTNYRPLPYTHTTASNSIYIQADGTNILTGTGTNMSGSTGVVTLEFIKP